MLSSERSEDLMSSNPGIETEFDLAFSPTSYSETSQSARFRAGNNFCAGQVEILQTAKKVKGL